MTDRNHHFWKSPRVAKVYNLGGGTSNSCSIIEAFRMAGEMTRGSVREDSLDDDPHSSCRLSMKPPPRAMADAEHPHSVPEHPGHFSNAMDALLIVNGQFYNFEV